MEFVLSGELDLSSAPEFRDKLSHALGDVADTTGSPARLVLDLHNLTFIDSAGIQALVAAKHRCLQQGVDLSLRVGDSQVQRLLTLAGVSEFLGLE